jgi:hypothetical protein
MRISSAHLVEHGAEGPHITARIYLLAVCLFRRHIGRSADHRALPSHRSLTGELGETKVDDLNLVAIGDEDVGRFDIAVDDAGLVGGLQRLGDLDGEAGRLVGGHRAALDPPFESLAGAEGHRDEELPLGRLSDIEYRADMGVVEARGRAGLAREAFAKHRILAPLEGQEFEGDCAVEAGVLGPVDDPHAPSAEAFEDAVVRDRATDHRSSVSPLLRRRVSAPLQGKGEGLRNE